MASAGDYKKTDDGKFVLVPATDALGFLITNNCRFIRGKSAYYTCGKSCRMYTFDVHLDDEGILYVPNRIFEEALKALQNHYKNFDISM